MVHKLKREVTSTKTHVVSMNELGRGSFKLRMLIYAGDDILVTYQDYPFMYIRPIQETDNFEGMRVITTLELLNKRTWVLEQIRKGNEFLLSYYKKEIAYVTPRIPEEAMERASAQGARFREL